MDNAEPVTEKSQTSSVEENNTLVTDIELQSKQAARSIEQSYVIQLSNLKTYIKNKSSLQFDDEFQVGIYDLLNWRATTRFFLYPAI